MRWRRLVRTVILYALLGAVATVLTSWAIHAVRFDMVRSIVNPPQTFVPSVTWPVDPEDARRIGIDTTIRPGEIGVDLQDEIWAMLRESRAAGMPYLDAAPGVQADAAWRRHHRPSGRLSPLPEYPFPFMLFEGESTRTGWRVLVSETNLWNEAFEPEHGWIGETLIMVRTGWPLLAFEAGAHYAQIVEMHPPHPTMHVSYLGFKRVEEVHHPPTLALSSGLELWSAPRPPITTGNASPIQYAVTDRFALPLLPLWSGFLINTAFYALLLFTLVRTPRVVRRALRRRGGRCVGCGYDRAGLDPAAACPECGAGVRLRRAGA